MRHCVSVSLLLMQGDKTSYLGRSETLTFLQLCNDSYNISSVTSDLQSQSHKNSENEKKLSNVRFYEGIQVMTREWESLRHLKSTHDSISIPSPCSPLFIRIAYIYSSIQIHMNSLKLTSSILLALICVFQITWIDRCEKMWWPWLTYDSRTTERCEMIWSHMTFEAINNH